MAVAAIQNAARRRNHKSGEVKKAACLSALSPPQFFAKVRQDRWCEDVRVRAFPMWGAVSRGPRVAARAVGCVAALAIAFLVLSPVRLAAHEGHDLDPALTAAADDARLVGQSDHFEFVVIPSPDGLAVLVDRLDSNEPATGLAVRVVTDGRKFDAKESSPGVYAVAAADTAGRSRPIAVTVASEHGEERFEEQFTGVLATDPTVPERARAGGAFGAWLRGAAFAALGFGIALAVFRTGRSRWGGALLIALALAFLLVQSSERRELPSVAAARAAPHRHQDGSVFLAKSAQRLLDVRTIAGAGEPRGRRHRAFGRVIRRSQRLGARPGRARRPHRARPRACLISASRSRQGRCSPIWCRRSPHSRNSRCGNRSPRSSATWRCWCRAPTPSAPSTPPCR